MSEKKRRGIAAPVFALGAVLATALSSNTSWRFFRDDLHITGSDAVGKAELIGMFAVLEVVLLACALGSWENLNNPEKQSPGTPGVVVWILAGFAAIPAFVVGGSFTGGVWRTFLGPVLAVFCFHMAMGMGIRHKRPDAKSQSALAVLGREVQQRLYARLGLAQRNRSALEIGRDRALTRAVILYGRLSARGRRDGRRGNRLAIALREQLRRAGVHDDPARMDLFLSQAAVYQHTDKLFGLEFASPWTARPAVVSRDIATVPADQVSVGHDAFPDATRRDTASHDTTTAEGTTPRDMTPATSDDTTSARPVTVVPVRSVPAVADDIGATAESAEVPQVTPVAMGPVVADSRATVVPAQRTPSVAALVRELLPEVGDDTAILQRVISERVGREIPEDTIRTARRRAAKHAKGHDNTSGPYL